MDETNLRNLSPLDGRYRDKTKESREIFSEESLINKRLTVEKQKIYDYSLIYQFRLY